MVAMNFIIISCYWPTIVLKQGGQHMNEVTAIELANRIHASLHLSGWLAGCSAELCRSIDSKTTYSQ